MNDAAKSDYIELLKKAIRIKTVNPPGDENKLAEYFVDFLTEHGIKSWIEPISENHENFIAKIDGVSSDNQVIFCGHLDTVPAGNEKWMYDPFSAATFDGKIYGRGASDMKSGLAAMVAAFVELKNSESAVPYDLYLIGTAGEEVNCLGSRAYIEKHDLSKTRLLVIGEPTDCTVITQQKGAAWIKVSAIGRTAHGSMPELGENAIYFINTFLDEINKCKAIWENNKNDVLGKATFSVNQICGGSAPNMIADECSVLIDFRLLPKQKLTDVTVFIDDILDKVKKQYPNIKAFSSVINKMKPVESPDDCKYVKAAIEINEALLNVPYRARGLKFYTDASILTENFNFPVIFYGPGDDTLAHQINEFVDSGKYIKAIEFYKKLAASC